MNAVFQHARPSSAVDGLALLAVRCLTLELETFPKPGLVSPVDCGSHGDMDARLFRRSGAVLEPFFGALAAAGGAGAPMAVLRRIGILAEAAMLDATRGVNTHRGAIFGLGLLCAAAGQEESRQPLGVTVRERWGPTILAPPPTAQPSTHGALAGLRYGAKGARGEAAAGFPSLYRIALPALHAGRLLVPGDDMAARVQACFALIASITDTNLLHRGGPDGLAFAQREARHFLESGGVGVADWRDRAILVHRRFMERRLSPGGSADLLAMALFVEAVEDPRALR